MKTWFYQAKIKRRKKEKTKMEMLSGERVKQARELRGLTQTELADKIGVNQSAIAKIPKGLNDIASGFSDVSVVLKIVSSIMDGSVLITRLFAESVK